MIRLDLRRNAVRIAMLAMAILVSGLFILLSFAHFVMAVVADARTPVSQEVIVATANYFPNSARVQARLAARLVESGVDESQSHEHTAERAVYHASRAVTLSPWSYELRVLLAAARELNGDLAGAETDLREALKLAPLNTNVRWRLANLLVRLDKQDQALNELRAVTDADPARLPATLNLVWQASGENLEAVKQVTASRPEAQLVLAQFLAQQAQVKAAADIFSQIDRHERFRLPGGGRLIDALINVGQIELADQLWRETVSGDHLVGRQLIWNESFETPINKGLAQFDWQIGQTRYARIGVVSGTAHTGQHSLRIKYAGIETTKLETEVRQLIVVRPGARYRLQCYTRTEALVTPDAPQLAVMKPGTSTPIAVSSVITTGSNDWQPLLVDFVVPDGINLLMITIKQTPEFSYVDPTQGTVWFDDFTLEEQ